MTLLELLPSLHQAATPRLDRSIWPLTTHVDEGRLCVGGVALTEVADEFRTPTYVVDEEDFRQRIRRYRATLPGVEVVYAGKSLLTTAVAHWVAEEGIGLDVCSGGELAIALAGGVDPSRIIMHGNAKTPDELRDAATIGVGRIVVDSPIEIAFLAGRVRRRQQVLLRVIPEIDIHGHPAVTTGVADQKFGFTLADGHAAAAAKRVLDQPWLDLVGLHCHIGSQVTDAGLYGTAIRRMIAAMAEVRDTHGVVLSELNIGGGHGVPYVCGDRALNLDELANVIDTALTTACAAHRFPRPTVVIEPGRAISARAGVTLYRVLTVKSQPGGRTFVAVDGGMSDNPRVALYGAKYTVVLANRHPVTPTRPVTVVGRHCEAGDEIARDVDLPTDLHPGDLLAVACTGAYHHSMASNYNAVGRPPLVAVREGRTRELVRRETITDLLRRDLGWTAEPDTAPFRQAQVHGE
ncbi:diaminopimelate decarboxylase [Mycobacterium sp.]|uniref:diaminopimelate decarboxylase n=1 Tax=Mycobacterium sp. TaxID=1785 RepID=UPI002C9BE142|nr:diaminopimelate decarboxylase [Mycobacterium sp.]HME49615.1 diaminopimelate decarboxylase [Mycobacterium sp.]